MRALSVLLAAGWWAVVSCGGGDASSDASTDDPAVSSTVATVAPGWIEEDVTFPFGDDLLHGRLTLPTDGEQHPAVVLVSGSEDLTGARDGVSNRSFVEHGDRLAREGFAVLRYDPPGVGRSTGEPGLPSLDRRAEETAAAVAHVASLSTIASDRIGLLGVSQGGWVISMTAARHPDEVAFVVSVVGSAQTVAEQQVYGIEAQSRAAGLSDEDVAKAVLVGRLLVDWQLVSPMFRDLNIAAADALGEGPWVDLLEVVYRSDDTDPVAAFADGIEALATMQDEPWAAALHLRELYVRRFESILPDLTVDQLTAMQAAMDATLTLDPADALTQVRVPVLAIFGELDVNVDTARSAPLYEQYLAEAGNDDATIVVVPDIGHDVIVTAEYWDTLTDWLRLRFTSAAG